MRHHAPVATRLPSLRPPIGFAHRGARAHAPENTIEAFRLALKLGAQALESDAWITADGVVVLEHDGTVGSVLRRRSIRSVKRADLPKHVPTLEELYEACGTDFDLSLDVKDHAAIDEVLAVARRAGAVERLWACHHDWERVASWRALDPDVKLVDSTRLRRIKEGAERRAAALAEARVDAVNMHNSDWTGGLTTLFHRFEILSFAWDCQYDRILDQMLDMGMDGVYSDHTDRLVDALGRAAAVRCLRARPRQLAAGSARSSTRSCQLTG